MAIAVYGATGYTGRLVTEELRARGAELVLGGRNRERLQSVADEHGGGARQVVARVDQPDALGRLMDGCTVVVNCAGPFTFAPAVAFEPAELLDDLAHDGVSWEVDGRPSDRP